MIFLAGVAGVIDINGTVIVELITFLVMMAILARYVYPEVVRLAEARQRQVADQLKEAEKARVAAEAALKEAEAKLNEARRTAQTVVDAAAKSAEQVRQELKQKAEDEARRIRESTLKEIDAERLKAIQSVRGEVAGLVVAASEEGRIDEWQRQLAALRDLMSDPTVEHVLTNPTIPAARRLDLMAAPKFLDPEATNLSRMLIETGRVEEIAGIVEEYETLADEAAGRVRATVTTAVELSSDDRERIREQLSARLGKEVRLTAAVDRRIVGGLKLQ